MTRTRTYEVTVEREGRWWVFSIPELDAAGQARSLAEVPREASGIIEAWDAEPTGPFEVHVTVTPPIERMWEAWAEAAREEEAGRQAQAHAAASRRAIVEELRASGVSAADVGAILGMSTQRVYQLQSERRSA